VYARAAAAGYSRRPVTRFGEGWLTMLYAGCCNCRAITPLYCAGALMPHGPVAVEPYGATGACPWCGPLPPWFICTMCGMNQMLCMPGSAAAARGWGQQNLAPVVQAPAGASQGTGTQLVQTFATELAKQFGGHLGAQFGDFSGQAIAGYWG